MRQPLYLTRSSLPKKSSQQGYALFIVLMIMIVIALLVVAAIQSYNTEQRISTNDADRKLATSLAEVALREGENRIIDFEEQTVTFTDNCTNGLCFTKGTSSSNSNIKMDGSSTVNAWERLCDGKACIDTNGTKVSLKTSDVKNEPRYIIEYLGIDPAKGSAIYRVTAKAWGKNKNTVVMLQSYVANE